MRNSRKDPKVKPAVVEKVEQVEGTYANFIAKIDIRHSRLQRALLKTQEFDTTLKEFIDSLGDLEKRLDEERPLDARIEELTEIQQEHEVIFVIFLFLF